MKDKTRIRKTVMIFGLVMFLLFANADFAGAAQADMDTVVSASLKILCDNEGGYNSVNPNDNGALSIGKLQWHGWRALSLLQTIVKANDAQAQKHLGNALYKEITTNDATKWGARKLTTAEAAAIKKLLATDESKAAQDELGNRDIASYIEQALRLGITNEPALVYFADLANQGGAGAAGRVGTAASKIAGSYGAVTLNELHEAAICDSVMGAYSTRRFHTYKYAAGLGWTYCNSGDSYIPYDYATAKDAGAAWIQRSLNLCMKAKLTLTGAYDEPTQAAVTAFQSAKGLTADGVAGKNTIIALIKAVATSEKVTPQTTPSSSQPQTPTEPSAVKPTETATAPSATKPAATKPTESATKPSEPQLEKTVLKSAQTGYVVNDTHGAFQLQVTSNHTTVPVKYASSNTSVVKVSADGKVTLTGTGDAKITASQAQTKTYAAASLTITVSVCSTNPADYPVPSGSLYAGKNMQKQHVQWMQAALVRLDKASITVNGVWTDTMTRLVTDFQKKCGISADGIVGDQTKELVKQMLAVKAKKPEVTVKSSAVSNTLTWKKYAKANRVFIYRKQNNDSYKRIKTIKKMSKTSYQDKKAEKGTVYYYTVKYAFVQNEMKVTGPSSKSVQGTLK